MRFFWATVNVALAIHLLREARASRRSIYAFAPWAKAKTIGRVAGGVSLLLLAAAVVLWGNG